MKKIEKCKKWFDAIAAYKGKAFEGRCETCLYQQDEQECPGRRED